MTRVGSSRAAARRSRNVVASARSPRSITRRVSASRDHPPQRRSMASAVVPRISTLAESIRAVETSIVPAATPAATRVNATAIVAATTAAPMRPRRNGPAVADARDERPQQRRRAARGRRRRGRTVAPSARARSLPPQRHVGPGDRVGRSGTLRGGGRGSRGRRHSQRGSTLRRTTRAPAPSSRYATRRAVGTPMVMTAAATKVRPTAMSNASTVRSAFGLACHSIQAKVAPVAIATHRMMRARASAITGAWCHLAGHFDRGPAWRRDQGRQPTPWPYTPAQAKSPRGARG